MRWKSFGALGVGILTLVSGCVAKNEVAPQSIDPVEIDEPNAVREIEGILETYDRAVSEMNLDLFLTILADPDSVSIVSPIGRIGSLDELELFFEGLQETYSQIELLFSNVSIRTEGLAGWATFDFTADAVLSDGQPVQFGGWETQFYRRTDNGWRLVHVHYSVPSAQPAEE